MPDNELQIAIEGAAREWFTATRQQLETNRARTGNSFADAGVASLELATLKLAAIITAHVQPVVGRLEVTEKYARSQEKNLARVAESPGANLGDSCVLIERKIERLERELAEAKARLESKRECSSCKEKAVDLAGYCSTCDTFTESSLLRTNMMKVFNEEAVREIESLRTSLAEALAERDRAVEALRETTQVVRGIDYPDSVNDRAAERGAEAMALAITEAVDKHYDAVLTAIRDGGGSNETK